MFIPDPTFFHPGSRIRIFSIPDPGSAPKNLSILKPKNGYQALGNMIRVVHISDPDTNFLPIPDPGVKKAPDPGSATLVFLCKKYSPVALGGFTKISSILFC
jgi:hypothetical protein